MFGLPKVPSRRALNKLLAEADANVQQFSRYAVHDVSGRTALECRSCHRIVFEAIEAPLLVDLFRAANKHDFEAHWREV